MNREMSDEEINETSQELVENINNNQNNDVQSNNSDSLSTSNASAQMNYGNRNYNVRRLSQNLKGQRKNTGGLIPRKNNNEQENNNPIKNKLNGNSDKGDSFKNRLKNNKSKNSFLLSRFRNRKKEDNQSENNDTSSNEDGTQEQNSNKEKAGVTRKIRIIKAVLSIIGFLTPVAMFIFIPIMAAAMLASTLGIAVTSPSSYNTNDFYSVNDKNSANYANEIKYYQKLDDVKKKFKENCDINLNVNYIHASLIYLYYRVDYSENFEKTDAAIDYTKMTGMVDSIYSSMTNDSCFVDYEVNGEFYDRLKTNSNFLNYYKDLLKEETIDEILENIFELAKSIEVDDSVTNTVIISDKLKVNTGNITISMKDYLMGVIYANVPKSELNNQEKLKAYAVAYTTEILSKSTVHEQTVLVSSSIRYCDVNSDCYGKGEISYSERENINKAINAVYGNVLVDSNGNYSDVDKTKLSNTTGSYQDMLISSTSNAKVQFLGANNYTTGATYGNNRVLTSVIYYDQNDYANVSFCGRTNGTIKTSGCGTTSMAIIVSTYENDRTYDPVNMMNQAHRWGYCGKGISGTSTGFFQKEARAMGYKYLKVGKSKTSDLNLVLSHLQQNHLVIVHIGAGHFTSGGHYMVLGGVDPNTKQVYVYDPYNKVNKSYRKTGNGWYSFNDIIAKEAFAFYIIWKG